ncbi:MAG: hypothetical protein HY238_01420, partial [Acidobacteria bacterium]|nr:hypothetical protein [Acidobacteriota bacterium]
MRARVAVAVLAGVGGVAWMAGGRAMLQAPVESAATAAFRVRLGAADRVARDWSGTLDAVGGEVVGLRLWRPRPGDVVQGKTAWKTATRVGSVFQRRPWEEEVIEPARPPILVPGLIVDVKQAKAVNFTTPQGTFRVDVDALQTARPVSLLGGSVLVDRVPAAQLMPASGYQNDFPAALAGTDGELWTAWVAYRNGADEVMARRFDGKAWGPARAVSERAGDYFLVKLGRDKQGRVWAVWSAQVDGNWDLYGRSFDGRLWGATTRLTEDAQPDIYHNLATDAKGNLWLVWQGFRKGKSDIFARRYDGAKWGAAEQVSTSPANDWEPAVAADAAGRVYVAWDSYDAGNYDVVMRSYADGRWSEVMPVAATPKFEAHVSLACDESGRLWAAWNEAGIHWGKDTGFLVRPNEGSRLYQWRSIGVAVYAGGQWMEPPRPVAVESGYDDLPQLVNDGKRMWLFWRKRFLRIQDTPSTTPAHRAAWEIRGKYYDGERWSEAVELPASQGR